MIDTPAPRSASSDAAAPADVGTLQWFVFGLFFIFGGITSLNDVLIPKLKELFELNYFEAMLIQSAFFAAYFIVSLPAALLIRRTGYLRGAALGLLVMMGGCLLFLPAANTGQFPAFLAALFVLASGVTIVQVVANPLISMLGEAKSASSRLTFAQAFNSLGTTVFPYVGAIVILGTLATVDPSTLTGPALTAYRAQETQVITWAYLAIAAAIFVVAAVVWMNRRRLTEDHGPAVNVAQAFALLKRPRFAFGSLGIFVYVGAEVAVASIMVNYLMQADTLGLAARQAGELLVFYWGGAMVGRFIGAAVLRVVQPWIVLATVASGSILLLSLSALTGGTVSGVAILAVGLMNAIMFPTIFTLASVGLGKRAAEGSGIICMAIVGGALIPPLTGAVADASTLRVALIVPIVCYAVIVAFATYCRRSSAAAVETPVEPY
ncbi:FHS family L-fucose permease-like MFS transporter [Brevundimonas alba]|uniref:FHS family L-fucose permease-like MFS transporter n=1 Tax=Brevundimonas alba TaxID=74314 RepID=A0A7X5YLV0_9CAUL|nr:sugar MFS transporter [Brevundimonas alba]NJC42118.1 FHS family L-fucose permease-like MFS transporter [Brevundimonas alba]